ncbi:hypothetical protein [Pendulispora albinea]|uniref:Uncharacterized protein n=1 Tax=Pendulispora albinea TaxID=2741071 RepID=A0ABZ2M0K6_9BACT
MPPFEAACWHGGRISGPDWLSYFTCAAVGDVLQSAMAERPECTMHVLCGHTHGGGVARVLPNLLVWTGAAECGAPEVQEPIIVS